MSTSLRVRRLMHTKGLSHTSGPEAKRKLGPFHPSWMLIGFFALLTGVGTLLLSLPGAVTDGSRASILDALFTATSAVSGTGLLVQDTATFWSFSGQVVIMVLVQIGGLAALIGSTILLLLIARRISAEDRSLVSGFMGVHSARGLRRLIVGIVLYALVAQLIGSYLLASRLSPSESQGYAWWLGIFHAASAFNNAGFELLGMARDLPDTSVQLILAGLSLLGALGFIVMVDLARGMFRRQLSLDTRIVLLASGLLLAVGMVAVLATETGNPQTLGPLSPGQKVVSALFHSVSARTTGLATADVSAFAYPTLLVIIALMFIGGASGSTAGGVKVNTFALLVGVTWSFVRGKRYAEVLGTRIHEEQVYRALAVAFLSMALIFVVTFMLSITERQSLLSELFETVSAFSTTGLSLGITTELSPAGKLLIAFAMFAGRVGPVTLAFALSQRRRPSYHVYAEEAINLG